ncbi:WhiB family transcriptional regulator [Streptomyces erythrochromogenes]
MRRRRHQYAKLSVRNSVKSIDSTTPASEPVLGLTAHAGEIRIPCRRNPGLWHSDLADERAAARELCRGCPILWNCRSAGRAGREYGIWGGEGEEEREALGLAPAGWHSSREEHCCLGLDCEVCTISLRRRKNRASLEKWVRRMGKAA